MNPKVMVVQLDVNSYKVENIERYIKSAKKNECDFVLFPEYIDRKFLMSQYDPYGAENFKKKLQCFSKKYGIYIITAFLQKENKKMYNKAIVINKKGELIMEYRKIALEKYFEERNLSRGDSLEVVETEFGKIGVLLCRDLLYPQLTQHLRRKGAKIIFCPTHWASYASEYEENGSKIKTNIPVDIDIKLLDIIPQARAMENEVFIVLANSGGMFRSQNYLVKLAGYSSITAPLHGIIQRLQHTEEGYFIQELNLDILEDSANTVAVNFLEF